MRPTPGMPAAASFQALPSRRSNARVGWQAGHRGVADKLVGQQGPIEGEIILYSLPQDVSSRRMLVDLGAQAGIQDGRCGPWTPLPAGVTKRDRRTLPIDVYH
jgi:hypothetical protein